MIEKKDNCTGCMACIDACPTKCIKPIEDEKGFLYPEVQIEKCIHCKKCDTVCPIQKQNEILIEKALFYAARNKDIEIQRSSSSGGVFTAFAESIIENKGYVFGGGWKNNSVSPIEIKNKTELESVRRSKYVQSNCVGIYKKIEEKLKQGNEVLFTGTPCQVNALSRYINPSLKKNLYLIELVCHGVPSPNVWKKYIQLLNRKFNKQNKAIKFIQFKYKDGKKYYWNHPGFRIVWDDDTEYVDFSNNTWYENGYLGNLFVRPSCYNCHFKQLATKADITIGDFWGCEKLYPDFFDKNGVSVIAVNSLKGKQMFNNVQNNLYFIQISKEDAIKYNQRFIRSTKPSVKSKKFWKEYLNKQERDSMSYDYVETLVNKCLKQSTFDRCILLLRKKFGKLKRKLIIITGKK